MHGPTFRRIICFRQGHWWLAGGDAGKDVRICCLLSDAGWKVGTLSRSLGLSRKTFERVATDSLGISAKLWMRQLRVVRARHLLREGVPAKNVAVELGFPNQSDFARDFKSLMGVAPSAFQWMEASRSGRIETDGESRR
ncbi:MAG: AraC family transcriptional regulator [Verrucomicrobiae bacterium]|nr:AraC family transcriptional regulator [Verrucomicrobiae bacterium]